MNNRGKQAPTIAEQRQRDLLHKAHKQGSYSKSWSKNPYSEKSQPELYNEWERGRTEGATP